MAASECWESSSGTLPVPAQLDLQMALRPEAAYEALMGHPPPLDDSEEAWQWAYRGTPAERERLRREIEGEPPEQLELFP